MGRSNKKKKTHRLGKSSATNEILKLGLEHLEKEDLLNAEQCFKDILRVDPKNADAWHLWGLVALKIKDFLNATGRIKRAIELNPAESMFCNNLAIVYLEQGMYQGAIESLLRSIELKKDFAGPYNNLGATFKELGRLDEAIGYYQRAIEIDPSYVNAHKNLGFAFLLLGDFSRGYLEYEWRVEVQNLLQLKLKTPKWNGSKINDCSIVLWSGQGLGDAIQSVRYASILKERGAKVVLALQPSLIALFQECLKDKFTIVDRDKCDINSYDYYTCLMSLPGIFWTNLENIPRSSYIFPPAQFRSRCKLPNSQFYRIGFVWSADKNNAALYQQKYCPIEHFISLLDIDDVSLYSLQVGEDAQELNDQRIEDLSPLIHDFVDTVCLISQLDLVITIDTAVAHLAGAMGKPTWVLLPYIPDWRWLLDRSDSPWYPSMKLFRQSERGNWENVFSQVKKNLNIFVKNRHTKCSEIQKKLELGIKYLNINNFNDAERSFQEIIEEQPDNFNAHHLLAEIAIKLENDSKAIEYLQKAVGLNPNYTDAHYNLGIVYVRVKQFEKAVESYQRIFKINPDYADAHFNLGFVLLLLGDFSQGFFEYEGRFKGKQFKHAAPKTPMWSGSNLQGKSIVLWNEQGLGDAIQFVRYGIKLKEMGARVDLAVQASLIPLFQECLKDEFEILNLNCDIYSYDEHISLLSLPYVFRTTLENIPFSREAYIFARDEFRPACQLPPTESYRIGIVWASDRNNPTLYKSKSCPVEFFLSLLDIEGVALYSLQVGEDAKGLNDQRIEDLSPLIQDFADTACLISQLDLVITIDTAVAHLAGAMGKPTWVLLPYIPDWRWLLDRSDSPWYPSMKLFRQSERGNWENVFSQVKENLNILVKNRHTKCSEIQKKLQLGIQYLNANNLDDAERSLQEVIEEQSDNADALHLLGLVSITKKNLFKAIELIEIAIRLNPKEPAFYNNLGFAYQQSKEYKLAIEAYKKAIQLEPNFADAYLNIGNIFKELNQLEESIEAYKKAIQLKPNNALAYFNLGNALAETENIDQAIESYQQAIEFKADFIDAHYNIGLALLLSGDLQKGFLEHENRFGVEQFKRFAPKTPMWNGSNLQGKSIVLWNEQGLGDAIQFVRYGIKLKEMGARVVALAVQAPLIPLFRDCLKDEFEALDRIGFDIYSYDEHISLLSLPYVFRTTLENIPFSREAYIFARDEFRPACQLPPTESYRIGIVWASDRNNPTLYKSKSCPIEFFLSLLDIEGVALYSLQVGEDAKGLNDQRIEDLSPLIHDFVDTACLISQLDLVITIDTAVAHLAGAMGKPTWVLLPYIPDWRWLLDRSDSPWYPTMRLFRQSEQGNWENVFSQVKENLNILVKNRHTKCSEIQKKLQLGIQYLNANNLDDAERSFQEVIEKQSDHPYACHLLGIVSSRKNDPYKAITLFDRAIQLKPAEAIFYNSLANVHAHQKEFEIAIKLYQKAIELNGEYGDAHSNLGNVFKETGDSQQAINSYQRAIEINPNLTEVHQNLAVIFVEKELWDYAIESYQRVIAQNSDHALAHVNLGNIFTKLENWHKAIELYQKAIEIKSDFAEAYFNLGYASMENQQFEKAIYAYQKAIELEPNDTRSFNNLANIFSGQKKLDKALELYQKVVTIKPENAEGHWNIALLILGSGDFKLGFEKYEWRFGLEEFKGMRPRSPMWDGSDLQGRTIVLWAEQGLGDVIQFVRYASMVKDRGANIVLSVHPQLISLFQKCLKDSFNVVDIHTCDIYQYEQHAALLSLPRILQTNLTNIPNSQESYIFPPIQLRPDCILSDLPLYRIGIVWSSEKTNTLFYKSKYCSPELFYSLLDHEGVALYSLQLGEDAKELSDQRIQDLSPLIHDFVDTACLISQLDLIITIDTAVAHLAGAMGKPVWVLLPYACDWRWLLNRQDSPWYPTMRLFRQVQPKDWQEVFSQVKERLSLVLTGQSPVFEVDQVENKLQLGLQCLNSDKLPEAEQYFQDVLQKQPDNSDARHLLGLVLAQKGETSKAIEQFEKSIALNPHSPLVLNNLGNSYKAQNFLEEAKKTYRKAIELKNDYGLAYFNLGIVLYEQELIEEAIESYLQAITNGVNSADIYNSLGYALVQQKQFTEGISYFQKAIEIEPENAAIIANLGLSQLILGEFVQGLPNYEWRFKGPQLQKFAPKSPMWNGSDLNGKTIVLWNEQGLGDAIQFVRYIRMVKERGGQVILSVPRTLVTLFQNCLKDEFKAFKVFNEKKSNIYHFDQHASLMSLPGIFQTTMADIPNSLYLSAPQDIHPKCILPTSESFKIGFVWASEKTSSLYKSKTCPLELFLGLVDLERVSLYSLQVGQDACQIEPYLVDSRIHNLNPLIRDFQDTASLISQLDLVITIDTSVAHLAGAMGKPVWVLLPYVSDWRWFLDRSDSPWYPTMRLFRQFKRGDWSAVFEQVKSKLTQVLQGNNPIFEIDNIQLESGIQQFQAGKLIEAEQIFRQILQLQPDNADTWHLLGVIAAQQGQSKEAIERFEKAININPNDSSFYNNLANAYTHLEQYTKAIKYYQKALKLKPDYNEAYYNLGNIFKHLKELDKAIESYQQSIAIDPNYIDAHYKLGILFKEKEKYDQAILSLEKVTQLKDDHLEAYYLLGYLYCNQKLLEKALKAYFKCLEIKPNLPESYYNIGLIYKGQHKLSQAIKSYQKALDIRSDYVDAHWNLSQVLLLSGDLQKGFLEYEYRFSIEQAIWPKFQTPMWDGRDLNGKNILLWNEQGLGDGIQFIRYARMVKQRGGRVILCVQAPLIPLFYECLKDEFKMVERDVCDIHTYDHHVSLLSLPYIFDTTLESIPTFAQGYIYLPNNFRKHCVLPHNDLYKIGIVWSSEKGNTTLYQQKYCPLEFFQCLLDLEKVALYSLQVGEDADQITTLLENERVENLTPLIHDFVDTVCLISQLDLVITIDTAVAHLAGAMGKPVWVLLPYLPDWRWMLARSDSPWYPTMRLFRQPGRGDWENVFEQVKNKLTEVLQGNNPIFAIDNISFELGIQQFQAGKLIEAERIFKQIIQLQPDNADAWNLLGVIAAQQGQKEEAIERFERAININPNEAVFYNNLGNAYTQLEQFEQAIGFYQKCIKLKPDYTEAYYNLGNILNEQKQFEQAIECYQQIIETNPNHPIAYFQLGILYGKQGLSDESIRNYRRALEINPDHSDTLNNLGHALFKLKQFTLAKQHFQRAIEVQSDNYNAHLNLAILLLLLGNWTEGFLQYRHRTNILTVKWVQLKPVMWDGADITNKKIVLWSEQGLGDSIEFIRYAQKVKELGAHVFLDVQPPLISLFRACLETEFDFIDHDNLDPNDYDEHISLMSLPHVFQTTPQNIPNSLYIFPPKSLPSHCILLSLEFLKIGIVWRSDKKNTGLYKQKSCSFDFFANLLELPGFSLYSLQIGEDAAEIEPWLKDPRIHDLSLLIEDFLDTASFISQLDLIITVDTAVAHLAGAMGKPVWVLLPYIPDWRWMLDRQDSPWYPTMRLFRQAKSGDWSTVFDKVKNKLTEVLQGSDPIFEIDRTTFNLLR